MLTATVFPHTAVRLLVILLFVRIASAHGAVVEELGGEQHEGRVTFENGAFNVSSPKGNQTIAFSRLLEIRYHTGSGGGESGAVRVHLSDGSIISGTVGAVSNLSAIPLGRPDGQTLNLPRTRVNTIEFNPMEGGGQPGVVNPLPHAVIMRNGKGIAAEIEWFTYLEVGLRTEAGRMRLSRDQIHQIIFGKSQSRSSGEEKEQVLVRSLQGDTVYGKLTVLDAKSVVIEHEIGELSFPVHTLFTVEAVSNRVVSLMTLKTQGVTETPFLDFMRPHKKNHSLFGGALNINGIRFDQGISAQSRTAITYEVNKRFKRFVATIGIDTTLTDRGNAEFVVLVDGKERKRVRLGGEDGLRFLSVDVAGARQLVLMLDYGAGGNGGDHGVWGNPRLIR